MNPRNSSSSATANRGNSDSTSGNGASPAPRFAMAGAGPPGPGPRSGLDWLLDRLIAFFTSIRLTVVCLALGALLVFFGTIAQVDLGLYKAQNEFFRSFFVRWGPPGASWKIVFPGGYLVGGFLVINLIASQIKRFTFTKDKIGLWMVHFGLILILLGQLGTDKLSRESALHLREGESKNYSESDRQAELALIDTTEPDLDKVVAIPQSVLMRQQEIRHPELPFVVRVKHFYPNSMVDNRAADATGPPVATRDIGARASVRELPRVTEMDSRDVPSAVIEFVSPQGSIGTWLVSEYIDGPQAFTYENRVWQLVLRNRRFYKPYSIQLLQFRHDIYPGTEIPKNFSSRVLLQRPDTGENREILIYMNNPLRYAGETYYQASYDKDNHGTILQVVHNPSWLTPYFSCILVGLGLVIHFAIHLLGFTFRRRIA